MAARLILGHTQKTFAFYTYTRSAAAVHSKVFIFSLHLITHTVCIFFPTFSSPGKKDTTVRNVLLPPLSAPPAPSYFVFLPSFSPLCWLWQRLPRQSWRGAARPCLSLVPLLYSVRRSMPMPTRHHPQRTQRAQPNWALLRLPHRCGSAKERAPPHVGRICRCQRRR